MGQQEERGIVPNRHRNLKQGCTRPKDDEPSADWVYEQGFA